MFVVVLFVFLVYCVVVFFLNPRSVFTFNNGCTQLLLNEGKYAFYDLIHGSDAIYQNLSKLLIHKASESDTQALCLVLAGHFCKVSENCLLIGNHSTCFLEKYSVIF
jgi:hypothetical protein